MRLALSALALSLVAVAPSPAGARERHFAFTEETETVARGELELAPWFAFRTGGEAFYSRFDARLALALGLSETLQTALYLNLSADAVEAPGVVVTQVFDAGVTWELKLRLSDPLADAVGSGLVVALSGFPSALDLELKLLLDKRLGDLLLALNLIGGLEVAHAADGGSTVRGTLEADLGLGWVVAGDVTLGLELRQITRVADGDVEAAALFGGLTLSCRVDRAWLALSVLPQLAGLAGSNGKSLNLKEFERVETRLLVGIHL